MLLLRRHWSSDWRRLFDDFALSKDLRVNVDNKDNQKECVNNGKDSILRRIKVFRVGLKDRQFLFFYSCRSQRDRDDEIIDALKIEDNIKRIIMAIKRIPTLEGNLKKNVK